MTTPFNSVQYTLSQYILQASSHITFYRLNSVEGEVR